MKKVFTLQSFLIFTLNLTAQLSPSVTPMAQVYGKIDTADLEMKSCDFEKDANAEVLFDKASVITSNNIILDRHVRVKIFNDFGKNQANIRLPIFYQGFDVGITDIKAETINLNNGKIEFTQLDKKQIFTEKIDRQQSATVFSMPNVKAGSVIEYKYSVYISSFPIWRFQSDIPTRYSEIQTAFGQRQGIQVIPHVKQPYIIDISSTDQAKQIKALSNIHSLPVEPFMGGRFDNLQCIEYIGVGKLIYTWPVISRLLLGFSDVAGQFERSITGEADIIKQTKNLKSADEKIAFIFDKVRDNITWNKITHYYTVDGTVRAWDNKTGNSAEINIIVYRLLKKAGIKAYPMIVSTKNSGKLSPADANFAHLKNLLVYVPIDSVKHYVLDATNKYNLFNVIPFDDLNTYGLCLDDSESEYSLIFIEDTNPVIQSVFLKAELKGDGMMSGNVEIERTSYYKIDAVERYKTNGEEKFVKYLQSGDNNLNIASLKLEGMEVDSLPLAIKANFKTVAASTDENYIYLKTNLFSLAGTNPFLSENRFSDINFGYLDNVSVNEIYQLPGEYKPDVLPKNVTIVMPDQSITFKRFIVTEDRKLLIKYAVMHKKTFYFTEDYQELRGFYKKMYELLNEQIVLKKSN